MHFLYPSVSLRTVSCSRELQHSGFGASKYMIHHCSAVRCQPRLYYSYFWRWALLTGYWRTLSVSVPGPCKKLPNLSVKIRLQTCYLDKPQPHYQWIKWRCEIVFHVTPNWSNSIWKHAHPRKWQVNKRNASETADVEISWQFPIMQPYWFFPGNIACLACLSCSNRWHHHHHHHSFLFKYFALYS